MSLMGNITLEQIHQFLRKMPVPPPQIAQALVESLMSHPQASMGPVDPGDGGGYQASLSTRQPGEPGTSIGAYTNPEAGVLGSLGGNTGFGNDQIGGTVGLSTQGQPFGSFNVNGATQGQFGPQDSDEKPSALAAAKKSMPKKKGKK